MGRQSYSKYRQQSWKLAAITRQLKGHHHCTAQSLAKELEVDPRTIRRYIEFMRDELDAPIVFDRAGGTYRLADSTWIMPSNICLAAAELRTLAVAVQAIRPVMPPPLPQRLDKLLVKLLDAVPEDDRAEIHRTQGQVEFVPAPVPAKGAEWFDPLHEGIRRQVSVDMTYHVLSRQQDTQRRFDPYYLRYYQGAWYVVGWDHLTRNWPIFKLARIRALKVSDDFYRVRSFSAAAYFKGSFGVMVGGPARPVRIRLTGYAASTADEQVWPAGFTYRATGPEEGILTGKVVQTADLIQWVASYQGDAEILPDEAPGGGG